MSSWSNSPHQWALGLFILKSLKLLGSSILGMVWVSTSVMRIDWTDLFNQSASSAVQSILIGPQSNWIVNWTGWTTRNGFFGLLFPQKLFFSYSDQPLVYFLWHMIKDSSYGGAIVLCLKNIFKEGESFSSQNLIFNPSLVDIKAWHLISSYDVAWVWKNCVLIVIFQPNSLLDFFFFLPYYWCTVFTDFVDG